MKKRIIILILLFSLLQILCAQVNKAISFSDDTESTEPIRHLTDGGSSYFEIEYNLPSISISNKSVNGIDYNFIHVKGFGKMGDVGKPALPAHTDIVLFPNDIKPTITILETEVQILEGYYIHPALEPARDTYGAPEPEFEIDNKTYSTNEFYPANPVEVTDIQYFREAPLGFVQITPVQFNPVTKQIKVYTKIKYRLEFNGSSHIYTEIADNNSKNYTSLLKNYVLNNQNISDGITHTESRDGEKNYIIITHSEYLSQANDLAEWKRQLGYSVEVVSQASWTAAQVKTAIHDLYDLWTPKPDYFVIIGDHTGGYAVPGEIHQDPNDGDDFATDLYFACMDGTGDYVPEMAHGRISVSSATEANTVIQKIINYEKNPVVNASYYANGLNCAMYQDNDSNGYADRRFCHTSENIRDYTISQGYSVERIYDTNTSANVSDLRYNNGYYSDGQLLPLELRSVSFNWDGGASNITSAINAGKFYVFHRDHGYVGGSGWASPYYTTTSMNNLTNGDLLPVVFSINCHTGEYQLSNCFAEKLLRMSNKGAVGVIAASYYSYSGYNDGFSIGMIDAIWHDPGLTANFGSGGISSPPPSSPTSDIFTMGDVLNQGLIRMIETWGNNTYTHELFHYFGDPAMKIWTANPNTNVITASHVGSLPVGSTSLTITNINCPDGLATLVFNGELIGETTLSGSSGTITFSALTNDASSAMLTISEHNWKPYTSSITVLDAVPDISINPTSYSETLGSNATQQRSLSISNDGETESILNYDILIIENNSADNISGSTFTSSETEYEQDTTFDLHLTVYNASSDAEWLDEATLDFPTGVTVNNSTNLTGGTAGDLISNGSTGNGAFIVWSDNNGGYGNIYSNESATTTVTISVSSGFSGDMDIDWTLSGDDYGSTPHDISGTLTLSQASAILSITSPNGGEAWAIGESQNITWNHSGAALADVKLELSTNNGTSYSEIIASTSNDGTYEWTVTGSISEQCLIRISDPSTPSTYDNSNAVFRIYESVNWLSIDQNSGSLGQGASDNLTLTFDSAGLSSGAYNASIEISSNDPDEPVVSVPVTLTVTGELTADFTADQTNVQVGTEIQFTDLSTGNPTSWEWDFDNDGTVDSNEQNPLFTYTEAGLFTVVLTVSDGSNTDTETKVDYITVGESIVADFEAIPLSGLVPLEVQFTDLSTGNPTSWEWDFDNDGTVDSNEQYPLFTYNEAGLYTVTLTVSDGSNTDTETKVDYITAGEPIVADFEASPLSGLVPLEVQFTDLSTGGFTELVRESKYSDNSKIVENDNSREITSWQWDFDNDGTIDSNEQNPLFTYNEAGLFTVTLTVSDGSNTDTETKVDYITVGESIVADFEASPLSGLVPLEVQFTDLSTGGLTELVRESKYSDNSKIVENDNSREITSWQWDFDNDGTIDSNEQNPLFTYIEAGLFTVALTVSDGSNTDTETKVDYITVGETIVADFEASPFSGFVLLDVQFTDLSTGSPTSWEWDFDNDGTIDSSIQNPQWTYYSRGFYTVALTSFVGTEEDTEIKVNYIELLNSQPVIQNQIIDFSFDEDTADTSIDLNNVFDDMDLPYGDELTYSYDGNTNIQISIVNGLVTLTPTSEWFGTESITFTATDDEMMFASDVVTITVDPVNDPPILNISGTFEADEDLPSVAYDFTDYCSQTWGETDALTLSATNSVHIDVSITGFDVIFEPNTLNWYGTEDITFYLDDNVADTRSSRDIVQQTIQVTINSIDDEIVVTDLSNATNTAGIWIPDDQTINELETLNFSITATDPDGNTLEYSWELDGIEVTTTELYDFATDYNSAGVYLITLDVTDNYGTRRNGGTNRDALYYEWNVTVIDVDQLIVVDEIIPPEGNQNIDEEAIINFSIDAFDPDGNDLEYSWELDGEEVSTISTYDFITNWQSSGDYEVSLNVNDNFGTSDNELNFNWDIHVNDTVGTEPNMLPVITQLYQNYPNPFNPSTTISFSIKEGDCGRLTIFNLKGQTVLADKFETGEYNFEWNADGLSSGIYFYKLTTPSDNITKKMLLMK
jgi:PKD repeat protein